jgi:hypothetical protein
MPHLTCTELANEQSIPESADIVVIGAGMAGLYCAWRLLRENPGLNIVIFDKSNRTGGRLDSDLVDFGNDGTVREEEGGMRFTFDTMDDLMSLFLILGLDDQIVPFPMQSGGNNRLYYRGHSFTVNDAATDSYAIWSDLYKLDAAEQNIDPNAIINSVFKRILAANPDFTQRPDPRTPEFWQAFRLECQWKDVLLKDWTLWNLFADMGYSNECITMLYRVAGFNGTFLSKMNAGEAYQLLEDFPAEPDFKTLEKGYSTLPNALVEQIGREKIFLNTALDSIDQTAGETGYTLTCSKVDADGPVETAAIHAQEVILALPRQALEKLFITSNALNRLPGNDSEILWDTLQTTTDQPLIKINLYYEKAWWGDAISGQPSVAFGPNFSDLPLGSVYPFYSIDEPLYAALEFEKWLKDCNKMVPDDLQKTIDKINNSKYEKAAALTIYCDYLNINFWKALQHNGPKFTSPEQEKYNNKEPQTLYPASEAVIREATKFFQALFNTHYVPRPVLTSARIWDGSTRFDDEPSEQFGFAVHQWGLHAQDDEVIEYMVEPLPQLYTCGEAFSDYQGWVEGALRSADLVLGQGFGLAPISQVYQEEYGVSPSDAIKAIYKVRRAEWIRKYIDPDFNPDADPETIDAPDVETAVESFGLSLSYS